jgi:hypothetical protein
MHPISAEPFPLQRDASPDSLGRRRRQARRWVRESREADGRATAQADLAWAHTPAAAHRLGAEHRDRNDRSAGFERQATDPAARRSERPGAYAGALGEDHDAVAAAQNRASGRHRFRVARAAVDRKGAERTEHPRLPALREQLALGHVIDGAAGERPDHERVEEAAVVGRQQQRSGAWDMLGALAPQPEADEEGGQQHDARGPVQNGVHAPREGACTKPLKGLALHALDTRGCADRYSGPG